jgi:hypothetical protein
MNPAQRRYMSRFIPTMVAYVVATIAVTWLFAHEPPQGPIRYLIALLPSIPILGIFLVIGRYLAEETDEFIRMRQVMALLIAIGLTLSFCATWGFLENYEVVPTIGVFNVVWGFFGAQLVSGAVVSLWYR